MYCMKLSERPEMTTPTCSACGTSRPPADLLVTWPSGRPDERTFVCRPGLDRQLDQRGRYGPTCFRAVVTCDADHQGIAAAV